LRCGRSRVGRRRRGKLAGLVASGRRGAASSAVDVRHATANHKGHRARECEQQSQFRAGQLVSREWQILAQISHDEAHAHGHRRRAARRLGKAQPSRRLRLHGPIVAARRQGGAQHKADQDQRPVAAGCCQRVGLARMEQKGDGAGRPGGDDAIDDIRKKARRIARRAAEKCITLQ
jgi:hypothetical protein